MALGLPEFGNDCKITVGALTAAGTSDVNGPTLDMAGFDSAFIVATFATPAANNFIQAQHDDASGMGTAADILGSKATPSGASDETAWLDIHQPTKRYVRAVFKRGTSTALGEIYCIRYNAAQKAQTNTTAGAVIGKILRSPTSGTP